VVNGAITLAAIRIAQGRLREAMRTYERALQLAMDQAIMPVRGAADNHVGMSELFREWNDLDAAGEHLLKSGEMGEHTGFPQYRYRRRVALARLREAQGDLDTALELLDEAQRLYMSDFSPNVRPIAALKTRVWLAQGRLDEAADWAREEGLSVHDEVGYLREFAHITLARLLLARHRYERAYSALAEAKGLLERLLQAAEEGQRMGSVVEILTLQALAHQMQGNIPAALAALERAMTLAEPEGYVRLFVDEGNPMALLLKEAAKQEIAPGYVRQLLSALGKSQDRAPANRQLVEPLSERELEVLRLLTTDLSGPQIAYELMVSLSTIRTHIRNI
jgi:LuxR family maltose regulon positive regulatory protein